MNATDQERELRASLEHHAETYAATHPIGLDSVKQRARGIRRRRQGTLVLAAAAVLAVVVPVGVALGPGTDSDGAPPVDRPSQSVSPAPQRFPDGPVQLTTSGLPHGADPRVPYVVYDENVLATANGDLQIPFPLTMAAPFRGGLLVIGSPGSQGLEADWLDGDLDVVRSRPTLGSGLALSDDDSQIAWTEATGHRSDPALLVASTTGGSAPREWTVRTGGGEIRPVGFLGEDRPVFTVIETELSGIAEPDGSITQLGGFLNVRAASSNAGLVAGQTSYHAGKSCFGAMDPGVSTTKTLWESCDWKPVEFSPDGRYLLATSAEADALGSPSAAVLDAGTGRVLVTYQAGHDDSLVMYQVEWEDDDSVIALVLDKLDVSMLRLDLDGHVEQVGRTGASENMNVPFRFAQVPAW